VTVEKHEINETWVHVPECMMEAFVGFNNCSWNSEGSENFSRWEKSWILVAVLFERLLFCKGRLYYERIAGILESWIPYSKMLRR